MPPVIVDTSVLLAFFDVSEPDHAAVAEVLLAAGALVVSPYVLAELDYLVAGRHGVIDELCGGAWDLARFDEDGLRRARGIIARYRGQRIGMADASIVVLAERCRTRAIATLDRRHFDVLRALDGGRFLLPPRAS